MSADLAYRWVPADTRGWLRTHAAALDASDALAPQVLARLAQAGLLRVGVPAALGGAGGDARDAAQAIAEVARLSLAAAFVLWGQRCFIDFVLQSENPGPRARWLAALLDGRQAGATGLSNAMKYLSCIEPLQLEAERGAGGWHVSGRMHWVTNLHVDGFAVAAAVRVAGSDTPLIVALDSASAGVRRSADLDLLALRGSHTAAIDLERAFVPDDAVLAEVRRTYFATSKRAQKSEILAIGAPIFDVNRRCIAVLSVAGPYDRIDVEAGRLALMRTVSRFMNQSGGWKPWGDAYG